MNAGTKKRARTALVFVMAGVTFGFSATVAAMLLYPEHWRVIEFEQSLLPDSRSPQRLGDGGVAADLLLCYPMGLAVTQDNALLITDRGRVRRGRLVWRVDTDELAHAFAGTGLQGYPDAAQAGSLKFAKPEGVAVGRNGEVYISDGTNHVVLRVTADGKVEKVAGTGQPGYSGDNGPAEQAMLHRPADIRLDREGNLYIADVRNFRIRKVDTLGRITTVVGNGTPGYSPDGTFAEEAMIDTAWGIALDAEERLLIADTNNHRVRRLNHDGRIVTIAGNGRPGYSGDGGNALDASFRYPEGLAADGQGRVYIGDEWNHAVRVIEPNGAISTLIGTGEPGFSPFGPITSKTAIDDPQNLLIDAQGHLLIAEGGNGRVIKVANGILYPVAGLGGTRSCSDLFLTSRATRESGSGLAM